MHRESLEPSKSCSLKCGKNFAICQDCFRRLMLHGMQYTQDCHLLSLQRMFGTETMVGRNMQWEQSISAVTMALFEDTGWYIANYSASPGVLRPSSHGYGTGCDFLTNACIVDGEVQDFGTGTFCNEKTEQSTIKCDVSHKRAAKCDLVDYESYADDPIYPYAANIPDSPSSEYQYFANSGLGSFLRFDADYCPTYSAPPDFVYEGGEPTGPQYIECLVKDTAPDDAYNFESFGSDDSTCFNTAGEIDRPLCLSIQCIDSGGDVTVAVTVGDGGEKVVCDRDGQLLDLPGLDIQIECSRKEVLCPR